MSMSRVVFTTITITITITTHHLLLCVRPTQNPGDANTE